MSSVALKRFLVPIQKILEDPDVNEITINRPNEYIIEKPGGKSFIETDLFSLSDLNEMSRLIASYSDQKINERTPILSGSLPGGERVQIVMPPAVHHGMFAMSIRNPSTLNLTLSDYAKRGAFKNVLTEQSPYRSPVDCLLLHYKKIGDIESFLKLAVKAKKNIVVSGGTSSGKTTFTNSLIKEIPLDERIITIEDVQEVDLLQRDKLHLIYSKGGQGTSNVTAKEALEACLRLNPKRILLSELRGEEAFYYLRAINSGHPGSITTLHADTVRGAFDQIVMMINQGGINLSEENIRAYLAKVIDVVVQFKNVEGERIMTELYFEPKGEDRRKNVTNILHDRRLDGRLNHTGGAQEKGNTNEFRINYVSEAV
jgi:type IV secretion system protein VirB11